MAVKRPPVLMMPLQQARCSASRPPKGARPARLASGRPGPAGHKPSSTYDPERQLRESVAAALRKGGAALAQTGGMLDA